VTAQTILSAANVELVRAGFEAFNAGDVDECMARMAPDIIINLAELSGPQYGREVWQQGFEMMKHAFPDLQAHIEDIFAAQDRVAVRAAVPWHPLRRIPGLPPDRPHHRVRKPRVLPHCR
jgi:predicted ester cyclase